MPEQTFTLAQVKEAFWKQFKGAGEIWFGDEGYDSEESCERKVSSEWEEFEEKLNATANNITG